MLHQSPVLNDLCELSCYHISLISYVYSDSSAKLLSCFHIMYIYVYIHDSFLI